MPLNLAAAAGHAANASNVCHQPGAFLGVGSVGCLHENLGSAMLLLLIIIATSLLLEHSVRAVRRAITCPQLKKIVNRVFEEVMIMGFISMTILALNATGVLQRLHIKGEDSLTSTERLHFYEFFHFIVFLTMLYFIGIVLLLLFIGTVVPKLVWGRRQRDDNDDSASEDWDEGVEDQDADGGNGTDADGGTGAGTRDEDVRHSTSTITTARYNAAGVRSSTMFRHRASSGMDLVQGSRAYSLLLQRYQREGWCFRFNLVKQWHLWKSFELLAYKICQHRSGYIYKNPTEMERLFGVNTHTSTINTLTYDSYHTLCMRNLLHHISHLHWSAFFVLLVIMVVPALYPTYDHWIFLGVGGILLGVNLIIFFKVLSILRGIVDDRLRVITTREIRRRMGESEDGEEMGMKYVPTRPPRLRTVALSVRAVIRMQMSALCHRQLHYHDPRFWFSNPHFLLRLFQFATIGQAFYLVWFTLVEWQTVQQKHAALPVMLLLPIVALCIITPLTMPSLVLVMSLTGIFVDLNASSVVSGRPLTNKERTAHIRLMRRSYLRRHYAARQGEFDSTASVVSTGRLTPTPQAQSMEVRSPSAVFLRIYDSPMAAIQAGKLGDPSASPIIQSPSGNRIHRDGSSSSLRRPRSGNSEAPGISQGDEPEESRSDSAAVAEIQTVHDDEYDVSATKWSPRHPRLERPTPAPSTTGEDSSTAHAYDYTRVSSPSFRGYCSKYGGYPDDY